MITALTGTPGTGKSTAASILVARDHVVTTVEKLAQECNAAVETDDGLEIDVDKLSSKLTGEEEKNTVVVGHLAHLMPNSLCIVLRCHPNLLKSRLEKRGYAEEKTRENAEAEAIDLILVEALEKCNVVFEIDTTDMSPEEVANAIESIINGEGVEFSPGNVDWSQAVMDWY